jgi:hexosaminidase
MQCPKCQERLRVEKLKGDRELQSYFVKRMEAFIASKGRRLIGWDEILEGGLPENATVMSWRGREPGAQAARLGHDVVMTPMLDLYFYNSQWSAPMEPGVNPAITLEHVYSYEPIPAELSKEQARHVLGAQGCIWREYMVEDEDVEYMAFPRACALAEVVWSPADGRDLDGF